MPDASRYPHPEPPNGRAWALSRVGRTNVASHRAGNRRVGVSIRPTTGPWIGPGTYDPPAPPTTNVLLPGLVKFSPTPRFKPKSSQDAIQAYRELLSEMNRFRIREEFADKTGRTYDFKATSRSERSSAAARLHNTTTLPHLSGSTTRFIGPGSYERDRRLEPQAFAQTKAVFGGTKPRFAGDEALFKRLAVQRNKQSTIEG